jgi:hypothetical protein
MHYRSLLEILANLILLTQISTLYLFRNPNLAVSFCIGWPEFIASASCGVSNESIQYQVSQMGPWVLKSVCEFLVWSPFFFVLFENVF